MGNGLGGPDKERRGGSGGERPAHDKVVAAAKNLLNRLHPPESYNLTAVTKGNMTIAVATDNPKYIAPAVAQDLQAVDMLLKIAEEDPFAPGIKKLELAGRSHMVKVERPASLFPLIALGLETITKVYRDSMTPAAVELHGQYAQRLEALSKKLT